MLKTVVPLNNFLESDFFFQDSLMNRNFKRTAFQKKKIFSNIINDFTITFGQFNASLLEKSII